MDRIQDLSFAHHSVVASLPAARRPLPAARIVLPADRHELVVRDIHDRPAIEVVDLEEVRRGAALAVLDVRAAVAVALDDP
jgi:hypothetical protein